AQDAPPATKLQTTEGMDPEVVSHLDALVAKVDANPRDAELHADLGLGYEANTLFEPALRCYSIAAVMLPDKPEWRYRLGRMLLAVGELEAAEKELAIAADALKNTPVIQAYLGSVRLDLGDISGSEAAWAAAIAGEAKQQGVVFPSSRVGMAMVRYAQERYEEAAALCREAIQHQPPYRHAHYLLAMCLFELGNDDMAELELALGMKAWPQFPTDPHAPRLAAHAKGYHHRMMTVENLLVGGQVQQALMMVQAVITDRPEDAMALNVLAKCQTALGQQAQAMETLLRSEQVDDTNVDTKIQLAVAFLNKAMGEVDPEQRAATVAEIIARTTAALQLAPRQGRSHFYHGFALLAQGNGQAAFDEMSLALRLGCDEPQLYRQLTTLAAQMNRLRDMVAFAERNVAQNPLDTGARQLLIQAYLTDKQLDEAEAAVTKLETFGDPNLAQWIPQVRRFIEVERAKLTPQPGPPLDEKDQGPTAPVKDGGEKQPSSDKQPK
ncbi:MAG: tetratricopeptide repeat protein, partial [Planctomycetota bacterium]|nr:tetratricopeptide repeat protein [Planctomycetota bacterium]